MSKKKIMAGLFCTSMLGAMLVGPSVSLAAPAPMDGTSTGSVEFKEKTIPNTDSSIGVLEVPTEFNFAKTEVAGTIPTSETVIDLDPTVESAPGANPATKRIVVADVRGEHKDGWKLTGKISSELTYTPSGGGTPKTLLGASIRMKQDLNYLPNAFDDPQDLATMVPSASFNADMLKHAPDVVTGSIHSSTTNDIVEIKNVDSPVLLASGETTSGAQDGRGEGAWAGEFTDIKLAIPADPMKNVMKNEKYSGVITWTMTDSAT
ncbi:WxL domain-containing protein [Enterococcus sp. DIV0756]|uniref:WxL domain-containing protein n=1 Tax=Enterococcus sp. DIV0756 TaxID=2774636 RepID=UPI003F1F9762